MSTYFDEIKATLKTTPRVWLVTGVAGFIGSNLLEALLVLGQRVVGLDNLSTGHRRNLADVRTAVGNHAWENFHFLEGDITNLETCRAACEGVELVLHQAALGSVPRSIEDPIRSHEANVNGSLNILVAARDSGVKRLVYAASSSTYGDHPGLPKVEDRIGAPLSPYAVTKYINELYAAVFADHYGLHSIGLRYFNVFGRRQDPNGAYSAVIPRWIGALLRQERCNINGDGETSRDFCYIDNVIQANLLAALATDKAAVNQVYNVAHGERTTLNQVYEMARAKLARSMPGVAELEPLYVDYRPGDIRHSHADIEKAIRLLGYRPTHSLEQGLEATLKWYIDQVQPEKT